MKRREDEPKFQGKRIEFNPFGDNIKRAVVVCCGDTHCPDNNPEVAIEELRKPFSSTRYPFGKYTPGAWFSRHAPVSEITAVVRARANFWTGAAAAIGRLALSLSEDIGEQAPDLVLVAHLGDRMAGPNPSDRDSKFRADFQEVVEDAGRNIAGKYPGTRVVPFLCTGDHDVREEGETYFWIQEFGDYTLAILGITAGPDWDLAKQEVLNYLKKNNNQGKVIVIGHNLLPSFPSLGFRAAVISGHYHLPVSFGPRRWPYHCLGAPSSNIPAGRRVPFSLVGCAVHKNLVFRRETVF